MTNYYIVINSDNTQLCYCGKEEDAIMMCNFGKGRTYKKVEIQNIIQVEKNYEY